MGKGSSRAWPEQLTVPEASAYVTENFYTVTETALRAQIARGTLDGAVIRENGSVRIDREKLDEILSVKYRGRVQA